MQKLQREKSEAEIAKWELAKANAADLSLDNLLSGFVSSMHTHDELSVQTQRDPELGQAIAYIQSLVSARRPSPEAIQVDLEKNDEDCDDLEVRRIAAEFKRERDQACADIAERESRAMQEEKQKRQKQCGVSTPLPAEEAAPATPQAGCNAEWVVVSTLIRDRLGATRKRVGEGWDRDSSQPTLIHGREPRHGFWARNTRK